VENYLNAYEDREVSLRGLKIPAIENLSVLQDQYDVIDLSDNEIKKLDNFPSMRRLNALILCNNSISKVGATLGENLPQLQSIILTNNRISNLFEIDHLATVKKLEMLSLMENPIALKPNYRLYCIHRMPLLKVLDFYKVTKQERDEASRLFKASSGKAFLQLIEHEKQQAASSSTQRSSTDEKKSIATELTDAQKQKVKHAIEQATTKEEIDAIEYQLRTGTFPFDGQAEVVGSIPPTASASQPTFAVTVADDMDLD
jgi:U2 small nuclear ribonucleoprotein A'